MLASLGHSSRHILPPPFPSPSIWSLNNDMGREGRSLALASTSGKHASRLPFPKKRKTGLVAISKETYVADVEKIIERDFVPDIPKLHNRMEWLEAVRTRDSAVIWGAQITYVLRRRENEREGGSHGFARLAKQTGRCWVWRVVSVPAFSSTMRILRMKKVLGIMQGFFSSRFIPRRRRHSLEYRTAPTFDEADELDSHREEQKFRELFGRHCVQIMPQDSKEAQHPKRRDRLKDEIRDEHANKASDDERLEELAKVLETINRHLLSVVEQLENLVRQKETLDGSHNSCEAVKSMSQSAMKRDGFKTVEKVVPAVTGDEGRTERDPESPRSRMGMKEKMRKREAQRISTRISGVRRGNGKQNQHRAAIQRLKEYDERFMGEALEEARKAAMAGEVPVGAVIVQNGKIVARAYNRVEADGDPTAHAEMLCLRSAARRLGDWRLVDTTLYVTLEPCPMCAGAILQSRVKGLVWGSRNTLLGADGSWVSLFPESEDDSYVESTKSEYKSLAHPFNTSLEVRREVLADDCATVMRNFFKTRRREKGRFTKTMPWWLPLPAWVLFKRLLHWLGIS